MQGYEHREVRVKYTTRDGLAVGGKDAVAGCDYVFSAGELCFAPSCKVADIYVRMHDNAMTEDDEQFYVDVTPCPGFPVDIRKPTARVVNMNSRGHGRLMFNEPVTEVAVTSLHAFVPVTRRKGASTRVSVKYHTEDADALAGAFLLGADLEGDSNC
jgi:hypothetical protein